MNATRIKLPVAWCVEKNIPEDKQEKELLFFVPLQSRTVVYTVAPNFYLRIKIRRHKNKYIVVFSSVMNVSVAACLLKFYSFCERTHRSINPLKHAP